MNKITT